ncbi:MAG: hypothetical protein MJZ37_03030 [Bacilli bacterium]|nr:hypothetical protein [Bacilli bacterium]
MGDKKIKKTKKEKKIKFGKKNPKFYKYFISLGVEDQNKLKKFFGELDDRLYVLGSDRKKIKNDFENALIEYFSMGFSLDKALELLDLTNLGGFYSRNPDFWLPLDEVGKSYTQFLDRSNMAVFREAFYLKDVIRPELLQMALTFTIKRFPYFAMSVKKGLFWHYLDSIRRRFAVEKEGPLPVQRIPIAVSGSKTFRVLYYQNRLSVEFFHCLTDGTGAKEFLKCLTATYLKLLDKPIAPSPLVMDCNSMVDDAEFANDFLKVKRKNNPAGYINKRALQLSGPLSKNRPCKVLHFRINTQSLKDVAAKYGVGLTPYVTTAIMFACKDAIDEIQGDVAIIMPVNMRKFIPSITLRNLSLYTGLRSPIGEIHDFDSLCKENSEKLKENVTAEKMLAMAAGTNGLMNNMRFLPLPLKVFGTRTLYQIFGDNVFTCPFSNLGKVDLPEDMAKEVLGMDFILGTSFFHRAQVTGCAVNGVTTLSISKYTKDPSFEERLYNIFKDDGLDVVVEGSEYNGN